MLGRWDKWIVKQTSDVPNIFFFMISCKILCKNPFNLFFYFFYIITKIKIKSFECTKSTRNEKNIYCLEHQTLGRWVVPPIKPAYYIEDFSKNINIMWKERFEIISWNLIFLIKFDLIKGFCTIVLWYLNMDFVKTM